MFKLQPCDPSFFETAPQKHRYTLDLPVPAEQVWFDLTSDDPLGWCRLLSGRWTSKRPYGVGTTRNMSVGKLLRIKEEFIAWDEGKRYAFMVKEANLPVFRRFAEDYRVEPTLMGSQFHWTFAYEPMPQVRPAIAMRLPNEALFRTFISDTKRHFRAR
jgi:hypothetical protein